MQTRGRSLLSGDLPTVRGLPARFSIRSLIDPTLCIHRAVLGPASTAGGGGGARASGGSGGGGLLAASVAAARARSGLPPTDPDEIREYGGSRLVLLPCSDSPADTWTAEALLGRFYYNNGTNYRQGFLKPAFDTSLCAYGVNASYTAGHPVWGVDDGQTAGGDGQPDEMDWFDEYTFDYAPYLRYGYDPAAVVTSGTFRSPNPLPPSMLDASGWGPFHSSWGPCMPNPTADSATPSVDPATETELRYHSWAFLDMQDTASISHLPRAARRGATVLLTLGPDRPQPDMSPDAGRVDAGDLSAALGGTDRPYGNGYSVLVSTELCATTGVVREGAQVRLAPCNPAMPSTEQVFQLVPRRDRSGSGGSGERRGARA